MKVTWFKEVPLVRYLEKGQCFNKYYIDEYSSMIMWAKEPYKRTFFLLWYNVRKTSFSYLLTSEANVIEKLPSIASRWYYS